ncbi:MAG: LysE family transporter [Thermodesulfobacteriota bacterium]|nr:LysE family transporter [Thermodesulfobacteriota bacterium]
MVSSGLEFISILRPLMMDTLAIGIVLGLSAGLAPGPLLALVISQTLRHNVKEGLKVALAPLITDLPIILVTLYVFMRLAQFELVLGIISFIGGFFILYLSYESLQTKPLEIGLEPTAPKSLRKGALVNALNPHPYLFWCSVGAPTMVKAQQETSFGATAFVVGFYLFLVGAKVATALLVSRSRTFLAGNVYIYTMRLLGVLLFVFAMLLFRDGLKLTGMI